MSLGSCVHGSSVIRTANGLRAIKHVFPKSPQPSTEVYVTPSADYRTKDIRSGLLFGNELTPPKYLYYTDEELTITIRTLSGKELIGSREAQVLTVNSETKKAEFTQLSYVGLKHHLVRVITNYDGMLEANVGMSQVSYTEFMYMSHVIQMQYVAWVLGRGVSYIGGLPSVTIRPFRYAAAIAAVAETMGCIATIRPSVCSGEPVFHVVLSPVYENSTMLRLILSAAAANPLWNYEGIAECLSKGELHNVDIISSLDKMYAHLAMSEIRHDSVIYIRRAQVMNIVTICMELTYRLYALIRVMGS
jgi:hypothetical protein